MRAARSVRDAVKKVEVPYVAAVALVLAVYLAIANVLRAAKWPHESTWAVGTVWFWAILVAAVFVPLFAFYKALDAYFEKRDKEVSEESQAKLQLTEDLRLLCQQTVAAIADQCKGVEVNDIAVQIWLTRPDDIFDRITRFFLPQERRSSGIEWRKGHGIAGTAWQIDDDLYSDLRPLRRKLGRLGSRKFNALPAQERYGMTSKEVKASRYTGICAIRIFSEAPGQPLLGFFIVDYVGTTGFDCVADSLAKRPVDTYIGGAGRFLTAWTEKIDQP
jgi:hypothetical protein